MSENDDSVPFKVLSPTKVWLSATAKNLAGMHNMSERDMARHLLSQHRLKEAGLVQTDGET